MAISPLSPEASILLLVLGVAYRMPSFVAFRNGHPYRLAIPFISIFPGRTLLGWTSTAPSVIFDCLEMEIRDRRF